jgi:hypothetical protein
MQNELGKVVEYAMFLILYFEDNGLLIAYSLQVALTICIRMYTMRRANAHNFVLALFIN